LCHLTQTSLQLKRSYITKYLHPPAFTNEICDMQCINDVGIVDNQIKTIVRLDWTQCFILQSQKLLACGASNHSSSSGNNSLISTLLEVDCSGNQVLLCRKCHACLSQSNGLIRWTALAVALHTMACQPQPQFQAKCSCSSAVLRVEQCGL
jgi:hypothetical protein